jgi:hypothetical protein
VQVFLQNYFTPCNVINSELSVIQKKQMTLLKLNVFQRQAQNNNSIYSMKISGLFTLIVILLFSFLFVSLETVVGIIKAVMGFGILVVIVISITIAILFKRMKMKTS